MNDQQPKARQIVLREVDARSPHGSVAPHETVEAVAERVVELLLPHLGGVPRLALSVNEACAALGVSWDFWSAHIASDVRMVRRGARKMIAVRELERWLEANAETVLGTGPRVARTTPLAGSSRRVGGDIPVSEGRKAA